MLDQRLATRVENFVSRLKRESVCMHGFILDVRGEVKATAYYPPFEEGKAHRMYSVSKSMTALAIGLLLDEGKISLTIWLLVIHAGSRACRPKSP